MFIGSSGFLFKGFPSCRLCCNVVEVGVAAVDVDVVTSCVWGRGAYIPANSNSFSSFCCCCCCCCRWWWDVWWCGGLLEESNLWRWPPVGIKSPPWCPPWRPSITWILWTPEPPRPPKSEKIGSSKGPPSIFDELKILLVLQNINYFLFSILRVTNNDAYFSSVK